MPSSLWKNTLFLLNTTVKPFQVSLVKLVVYLSD